MTTNRVYYQVKPYLPWGLRMVLRRMVARWQRKACQDVWPINESANQTPAHWPGWPEGKKFAFVLTHDVEGPAGLAKCRQLMQLDKEFGFRACFNFIPEGDYAVSRELRADLIQNGFEVGVHDLRHDGRLYQSRRIFSENAKWINHYLKEWSATGFRSGFMLRNLEWLHDLNIQYDTSTFDTDPFEPQPAGVGTIFPFWIQSTDSEKGYVELPYTLPQDSTLFLVLREPTPEIWLQKLDWIARNGGMALVDTHPDYLRFPDEPASPGTYPVAHYLKLLEYVRERYAGKYWQPLPHEVAGLVSGNRLPHQNEIIKELSTQGTMLEYQPVLMASDGSTNGSATAVAPPPPARSEPDQAADRFNQEFFETAGRQNVGAAKGCRLRGRHVAVLLFSHYPSDPRPKRAAEALAQEGAEVDFLCLQGDPTEAKRESVNGLEIFRVPLKRRRGGKLDYFFQYGAFICIAFFFLASRSLRRRYDLVHVHNMPDILVFSALIPKLLGAKVVLDLHDPMPELMLTIFKLSPESFSVRMLKMFEKWSTSFASVVMTVNLASKRIYASRSCVPEKIKVVMNSPNEEVFRFQLPPPAGSKANSNGNYTIMYHGSLLPRNGFDLAVQALETVRKSIPGASLLVCGERTPFFESVMATASQRGLQGAVNYVGKKKLEGIVEAMNLCDLGIIPNHRNIFTEMNTPTRIFEYLSRGKPVIAPRAQGIQDYFGEQDLIYFELGDAGDLARKIEYACFHPAEVRATVERGQKVYLAHRWSRESLGFVDTIADLLGQR